MEHILYWLWLTLKNRMTPLKAERLIEHFGSVEGVYNAADYSEAGGLDIKLIAELADKRLTDAIKINERVNELGAAAVPIDSPDYPDALRNIPKPPHVLYIRGMIPNWNSLFMISVVGTRKCSQYGKTVTRDLCANLVNNGVTIVSGMADGIDSAAAWAAIDAGGKTIAVLGSGIDVIYPRTNASLYNEICRNGCVISEYPPGSPPSRWKFPQRNRIIAGLSKGVLVTEAAEGSGSLITAREALNVGRRLYAVPGGVFHESYDGETTVIQRKAKLINRAEYIIDDLGGAPHESAQTEWRSTADKLTDITAAPPKRSALPRTETKIVQKSAKADEKYKNLSDIERKIVTAIEKKGMSADELSRELNTPVFRLNAALTMLELKSVLKRLPGNRFEIK